MKKRWQLAQQLKGSLTALPIFQAHYKMETKGKKRRKKKKEKEEKEGEKNLPSLWIEHSTSAIWTDLQCSALLFFG